MSVQYRWQILVFASIVCVSCSRAPRPDLYPPGTKVSFYTSVSAERINLELGENSSKLFLEMLAKTPVRSQISQMPAEPVGVFTVQNNKYYWHGNGVIRGKGRRERLWHGVFLQRFIQDLGGLTLEDKTTVTFSNILYQIEIDPDVRQTPLEGPGAYPGGPDALHPLVIDMDNLPGFRPEQ